VKEEPGRTSNDIAGPEEAELPSQQVIIPARRGLFLIRQIKGHNHGSYLGTGSKLALSFTVFYHNLDYKEKETVVGGR
jgi:hypothetical protein